MVKKCKKKQPSFNIEGENIAIFCSDCKEPGMIDVKTKKCDKCKKKVPLFNFEGEKHGRFCGDCKETDMMIKILNFIL